jgi:glucose/mannose-6-phosphate isomerase
MNILDSPGKIREADSQVTLTTICSFADQVRQAWGEVNKLELPQKLRGAKNIILAGMGGSALPGIILKSLETSLLRVPFEIVSGNNLPGYANNDTLVILSSYSGTTAETLRCSRRAIEITDRLFVYTTGGELARWSKNNKIPSYQPYPIFNPSAQPRFSLGYSLTCFLALLTRLGYLRLNRRTISPLIDLLHRQNALYEPDNPSATNPAKQLAISLVNTFPILIGGPHLAGAVTAVRNMFHETAKTIAIDFEVPELNHHLLDSLSYPDFLPSRLEFVVFRSSNYTRDVKKRIQLTSQVLDKRKIKWTVADVSAPTPLYEVFKVVQFGGFVVFYLAVLNGVDPAAVPWVDYFKKKLGTD